MSLLFNNGQCLTLNISEAVLEEKKKKYGIQLLEEKIRKLELWNRGKKGIIINIGIKSSLLQTDVKHNGRLGKNYNICTVCVFKKFIYVNMREQVHCKVKVTRIHAYVIKL
jgi:hypothetical protein